MENVIDFRMNWRVGTRRMNTRIVLSPGVFSRKLEGVGLNGVLSHQGLSLDLTACNELVIENLEIRMTKKAHPSDSVFMNGYQSWTDSREFTTGEKMDRLGLLAALTMKKYRFDCYGDYRFVKTDRRRGHFHGFSYMYLRSSSTYDLIASLDEDSAFTIFTYDMTHGRLVARRDCAGRVLHSGQGFTAFSLVFPSGTESEVFDALFKALGRGKPTAKPMPGWTSWYDHYQDIDEKIIRENLAAFKSASPGEAIFQIDDGYQTAIGDWLSIDATKFPGGMKPLAQAIHSAGFKAGLWLAPFAAQTCSRLAHDHPEWLLRDDKGQALLGGSNWGGFYALDIRHRGLRDYITRVFSTVLDDWGFDMVKLDFLYAACLRSFPEATRGELMAQSMSFLRELVGPKLILGCGVPLASAFGRVDYCRIGCDIDLRWNEPWYMNALHRERVSTLRALENSVGRRALDGRAFLNDPDVFFLRSERNSFSQAQKELIFFINTLFGSLVFTSDKVDEYGDRAQSVFSGLNRAMEREVVEVVRHKGRPILEVRFKEGLVTHWAAVNLGGQKAAFRGNLSGTLGDECIGPYAVIIR
jgi:alpha-galactosidase